MDQGHSQSPDWLAGQASLARGSTPYWLAGVLALVSTPSRPPVFACQRLTGSRVKAVPPREHMASGMRTTLEHMQHTAVGCPSRCVVRCLFPGFKRPSSCPAEHTWHSRRIVLPTGPPHARSPPRRMPCSTIRWPCARLGSRRIVLPAGPQRMP